MRFSTALLLTALASPVAAQQLEIHHIDVDQGDATLIVTPNGSTLLIDAGLDSRGDEVAAFLGAAGHTALDAFLNTHYDADHYGGVDVMLTQGVTVGAWYERGEHQHLPASKTGQNEYQEYIGATQNPTQLQAGDVIDLDPEVTITVVAVNGHVHGAVGRYRINSLDENGYSVALLISFQGFNYFIAGDLTEEVEERIVAEAALGEIDVYKVSHHGSATSSTAEFVQRIRPEVAIISNGSHCGYRHPQASVLANLRLIPGVAIYQTNQLSCANMGSGENVNNANIADPQTSDSDGHISIIVSDGSFVVSLPARGTSQAFEIN